MNLLLKFVKIGALLLLILVLAVLFAPTLKGPFIVIHFSTTLRSWLLAQGVLLGFAVAAHLLIPAAAMVRCALFVRATVPSTAGFSPAIAPLRC